MNELPIVAYENAQILDCNSDYRGFVYTQGAYILAVSAEPLPLPIAKTIDVGGKVLMPALIDLHTHLRDPGYTYKETLETGMKAALKGGYATLCAMANTNPVCATPEQVLAIQSRAERLRLTRLYQSAAAGEELEDQIPTDYAALSNVCRIITNDGKTIFSDEFMRELLLASKQYGFLISTHCQPEEEIVARDLKLLKEVGGNLHIGHISTKKTVELVRSAKAQGLQLTCEVTPHHLFGCGLDYRVNPPLNTNEDVQALLAGIVDGTIDCLATDHAPHSVEDKRNGMPGISNIEYALQVYWHVFAQHGISLQTLSRLASHNPAERLHIRAGLIEPGYLADLIVFDRDITTDINASKMISKSHNTPFDGRQVRGRVLKTMVGGELRYDYGFAR